MPVDTFLQPHPPAQKRRSGLSLSSYVLLVGIALVALVFGVALIQGNATQPTTGPAPDFEITTFDGQTMTLESLRGRIVVLNFWASWCGPCRDEAPELERLWQRYRDAGVVVVGITYVDTDSASMQFIEDYNLTYPNGPDVGTRISERYHIQGVPETFVIDREGRIQAFIYAPTTEAELSRIIDDILARETAS